MLKRSKKSAQTKIGSLSECKIVKWLKVYLKNALKMKVKGISLGANDMIYDIVLLA